MKTKKGFTLIELLIVIAIIGILSAALLPTILNAPARGRDAARIGQINSIVAALEAYNSDNGSYPDDAGVCTNLAGMWGDNPKAYFSGGSTPKDPSVTRTDDAKLSTCLASGDYYYKYIGDVDVAEYILATKMEIEGNNNTDTGPSDVTTVLAPAAESACAEGCDYYILVK